MDAWYAVYEVATGTLVSTGTEIADPLPLGLKVAALSGRPEAGADWNTQTLAFDTPQAQLERDRIAEFREDPAVQKVLSELDGNTIARVQDAVTRIFGDVRGL